MAMPNERLTAISRSYIPRDFQYGQREQSTMNQNERCAQLIGQEGKKKFGTCEQKQLFLILMWFNKHPRYVSVQRCH